MVLFSPPAGKCTLTLHNGVALNVELGFRRLGGSLSHSLSLQFIVLCMSISTCLSMIKFMAKLCK